MPRHSTRFFVIILLSGLIASNYLSAQITDRPRPEEWKQLVRGAAFKDRFSPMSKGTLSSKTWGRDSVLPRYIDNGIEDSTRSYWGGNIIKGKDDQYHLFVCGWLENSPKGHYEWPRSIVYHTVSKNMHGPFIIKDTIGRGHNPEIFKLNDGKLVLYVIDANYIAEDENGPWVKSKFDFDPRDRPIIEGLSNLTFAKREDGSFVMICRGGGSWISKTGLSTYNQVSDKRAYPAVKGEFEDPVIWRDHVQYNLIVNDWLGRIAFYLRSKDGVNWVTDPGEAYVPGISYHEDGHVEWWFKYERMKVFQDSYGRAIQANFAVVDLQKEEDMGNDNHSSKNIAIPLNPGVLLTMLNKELPNRTTKNIQLKISAEKGFNPQTDIDIASLRFGASSEVNFGRGAKVISTEKQGEDLIATFDNTGHGLSKEEFAPKLIGKYKSGKILYGFTRVPWVIYNEPILSARKPAFTESISKLQMDIPVENFGQVASNKGSVEIFFAINGQQKQLAKGNVPGILPYQKTTVRLTGENSFEKGKEYAFTVLLFNENNTKYEYNFKAVPVK